MEETKLTAKEIAQKRKFEDRLKKYSIDLDCPPGNPRPGDLIEGVLEGTGLEVNDFNTTHPIFGNQTWMLKDNNVDKEYLFKQARPVLNRIEQLYQRGLFSTKGKEEQEIVQPFTNSPGLVWVMRAR